MSWRAIRGNIQLETDSIGPTVGRDNTEVQELNISPYCPTITNAITYLLL